MKNIIKMICGIFVGVGLLAGSFAVAAAKGATIADSMAVMFSSSSAIDVRMAIVCAVLAAVVGIVTVARRSRKTIFKKARRGVHEKFLRKREVEYLDI